jgi:oxaloacetate decarboxylase beta subunit
MELGWDHVGRLLGGVPSLTWANLVMMAIGVLLIYLGIAKQYEPILLIPIGMGAVLANIPGAGMGVNLHAVASGEQTSGLFYTLYRAGIETELFPLLLFIGIGAIWMVIWRAVQGQRVKSIPESPVEGT